MNVVFTREAFGVLMRRLTTQSRSWPRSLIVRYGRELEITMLAIAFIFSFYLAFRLLYFIPQAALLQQPEQFSLATDLLDDLELLIEERQTALEVGIVLPERPVLSE